MRVIHKQQIRQDSSGYCFLNLPQFSKILKIAIDPKDGATYAWYLFDQFHEKMLEPKRFFIIGTGWDIGDDNLEYISTVFQGQFVWHYFEERA